MTFKAAPPLSSLRPFFNWSIARVYSLRSSLSQVDPNFTGTSVFVNNLSWSTTSDELSAYFAAHGSLSALIATRKDGKSRGWGTVQFSTPEQALKAVEDMKGTDFGGRDIECLIDKKA